MRIRMLIPRLLLCGVAISLGGSEDPDSPSIGLRVLNVQDAAEALDTKKFPLPKEGVLVLNVRRYSTADVAGFKPGDVVTTFRGKKVTDTHEYLKLANESAVGKKLAVHIRRPQTVGNRTTWRQLTLTCEPLTKKEACLAAIREKKDEVKGVTLHKHRDSSEFVNERSEWILYFASSDGKPQGPRMQIQYVADDWLFIEGYTIRAGAKTLTIKPGLSEVQRDNGLVGNDAKIWEWYDAPISHEQLTALREILAANKVVLRHDGRQYYKDRELRWDELDRMRVVLDAYKYMGGE